MPRPLKYDWTDKRDICHKLYVEQRLPVPKIVEYFVNHFKLPESELPACRDFQRQFKRWDFPSRISKLNPEEATKLKDRLHDLFNQNLTAHQVLEQLNDEGWELDQYRFRRLRKQYGLLYRTIVNGFRPHPGTKKRKRGDGEATSEEGGQDEEEIEINDQAETPSEPPPIPAEEAARRAQRLVDLQVQSDQRLQTGKRRRRIRGHGHLPPDAPGMQPRYGSETSLDECKAFLHLTNDIYSQIRSQYEAICREMGIVKMSLCAEGQWQASKDRLVRENMHLSSVLHPLQQDIDKRMNALNCICADVTKRMRSGEKALTISDANNALGLGPIESKEIRRLFYEVLEADHFTTVFACGNEHYEELQQQWHAKSDFLQRVLAEGDPLKIRAVTVLTKDARKRFQDDDIKKNPQARTSQKNSYGPGPGPAPSNVRKKARATTSNAQPVAPAPTAASNTSTAQRLPRSVFPLGPAWEGLEPPRHRMSTLYDLSPEINFDLDPLLSKTTHGPPWPPPMSSSMDIDAPLTRAAPAPSGITAYFRLAPNSQLVGNHPRMWLGKLAGPSMSELEKAAISKAGAARLTKVNGIVKNEDGMEDSWLIESDDELGVYLGEAGEKATFVVVLEGGYA